MNLLHIENLRGIRNLDFPIPVRAGAYLLTGANGTGKSTVMSCLARLGDPDALERFFTPDIIFRDSLAGEVYNDAVIRFKTDKFQTEFRYRDGKWHADSEENCKAAFASFGFPRAVFSGSKAKRYPQPGETFSVNDLRPVPDEIKNAAAEIFDNNRFHNLEVIRSRITGTDFYLFHLFSGGEDYFFSENNFSAGERAVLRLIALLAGLPPGSFVLVDESEMALHPKSQKRLLDYLQRTALEHSFTILVSTQSASLIRLTEQKRLIFLENDPEAGLVCRTDVYPAAILGEMAIAEEILPERLLLVEDQEAAMLLEAIMEKMQNSLIRDLPFWRILPVGGYMQVVILLDNLAKVLPSYVKRRAVLDRDAEPSIRHTLESPGKSHFDVVQRNRKRIFFLPCTPEQGVIRLLESSVTEHSRGLSEMFGGRSIDLNDVFYSEHYRSIPGDSRSDCKDKMSLIVHALIRLTGGPEQFIRKNLYRYYAEHRYTDIRELKEDYCPLLFRD